MSRIRPACSTALGYIATRLPMRSGMSSRGMPFRVVVDDGVITAFSDFPFDDRGSAYRGAESLSQ